MSADDVRFDSDRQGRIGLPEAVFAEGKSTAQLTAIIGDPSHERSGLLITRLSEAAHSHLPDEVRSILDYDPLSGTAFAGHVAAQPSPRVGVVTAGTTDLRVAREAARTLEFHGIGSQMFADVGVAGLWRLLERRDEISTFPVVIAVAGMEGALFSVLGGLVPSMLIAVPTSSGYGVAREGELALHAALSSCAPGVVACNIDNGYGAACAAARVLAHIDAARTVDKTSDH